MEQLYFRQLLAGRDFAVSDDAARQMENFIYLIGDTQTRECLIVDPAWAVKEVIDIAQGDGMRIIGALATHYHPDHIGGNLFGMKIEGLAQLQELNPCLVHVHKLEARGVCQVTGLSTSDLDLHESGDKIQVGKIEIELLHTPGHTPGSQCFRLKDRLISGDTLFLQGCGRVDLPGGSLEEMYDTLTRRLATLPDNMVLYPGHAYAGEHGPLSEVRAHNHMLQIKDFSAWRKMHSR